MSGVGLGSQARFALWSATAAVVQQMKQIHRMGRRRTWKRATTTSDRGFYCDLDSADKGRGPEETIKTS